MAQRKPYNPNTKYGRRKMREEAYKWKASLPPEERAKVESQEFFFGLIILIIIGLIIFAIGGSEALMRWLSGKAAFK
jgi:hypothetical protein